MPPTERLRIDWMPGKAGREALDLLQRLQPELSRQALIDFAMVVALSALRSAARPAWRPPAMYGVNRDVWRLPTDCKSDEPGTN
jgi:hypothetical protein